jgi:hypothetical protein
MRAIESMPHVSIGDAYCYLDKASQIIMMRRNAYHLVQFWDHALKVDPSLIDPIIKLKADCPEI